MDLSILAGTVGTAVESPSTEAIENSKHDWKFTLLSDLKVQPVDWLWHELIMADEINILAGPGSAFKSAFAHEVAGRYLRGKLERSGRKVMIFDTENNSRLPARLYAAGVLGDNRDRVIVNPVVVRNGEEDVPSFPLDTDWLIALCKAQNVGLIILDPIVDYMGPGLDETNKQDVRRFLVDLQRACTECNVTALGVHHQIKSPKGSGRGRISGSAAWVDKVRVALQFGFSEADNAGVMTLVKCNDVEGEPSYEFWSESVHLDGDPLAPTVPRFVLGDSTADKAARLQARAAESDESTEAVDGKPRDRAKAVFLAARGRGEEISVESVMEQTGVSRATAFRAKADADAAYESRPDVQTPDLKAA